jgi:hypothetical protein
LDKIAGYARLFFDRRDPENAKDGFGNFLKRKGMLMLSL